MDAPARRIAFAVVAAVLIGLFLWLGFWQLGRLDERRSANARRRALMERPVLELGGGEAPRTLPGGDSLHWRRVRVEGRLDYGREVVLAPRSLDGTPAVYLLTPLVVADPAGGDSVAVLVLRGAVPAPDGFHAPVGEARPPEARPATGPADETADRDEAAPPVTVHGLALPPPEGERAPRPDTLHSDVGVHPVLSRLDLDLLRELLPYPVLETYVQADSATARVPPSQGVRLPLRLEPPRLDDGPHLMYAIQWFAFAAILLVGGTIFLLWPEV